MGENGGCFGNLSELPVQILDGIGGIHDFSDFCWIAEHWGELMPFVLPGFEVYGILRPLLLHCPKCRESGFLTRRSVDTPEIRAEVLLVLVGNILHGIADLMHDALLDIGVREYRMNRIGESRESIHAGNQDISNSPVFDFSEYRQPELRSLCFIDPESQNLTVSLDSYPHHGVAALVHNPAGIPKS